MWLVPLCDIPDDPSPPHLTATDHLTFDSHSSNFSSSRHLSFIFQLKKEFYATTHVR